MASFDLDAPYAHPVDFALLRDVPVSLFKRELVLSRTAEALRTIGYQIVELDAGLWNAAGDMHAALAAALDFPDHFGHNLDALDDCLDDVAEGQYGWSVGSTGLAVVVRRFDAFWMRDRRLAQALAHVAVGQSRYDMSFGHRILWLLQTPEHDIEFEPIGCARPTRSPQDQATAPDFDA